MEERPVERLHREVCLPRHEVDRLLRCFNRGTKMPFVHPKRDSREASDAFVPSMEVRRQTKRVLLSHGLVRRMTGKVSLAEKEVGSA
jgi:hypothetical protein